MVKTHHEDDEEDDEEYSSKTPDGSSQKGKLEGKSNDGKGNSHRSKHSETEQRRRIKINERFQTLRDVMPENDRKRDRASFLLEVIQYIQFLQEKLKTYEGTYYQGWSAEPAKLMPWKGNSDSAPVEGFVEQSQIIRNGSTHEDNIFINSTLLASAQNLVEPNLTAAALYSAADDRHVAASEAIDFNMPLQSNIFENESDFPSYEEVKVDIDEAGAPNAYSQRLQNTLNRTLASMGVDMSQANIRVQLDIGKRPSNGATATTLSSEESYDHTHKRLRTED